MKLREGLGIVIGLILFMATDISALTIAVPTDQPTIQAGIDAAADNDTVYVAKIWTGKDWLEYSGPGNRDLDFGGKAIRVVGESYPVINCEGSDIDPHRGFIFHNGEDTLSKVEYFEIRNGYAADGGGILCQSSSGPIIRRCKITNCTAVDGGGGIMCESSDPLIDQCEITNCTAGNGGGGIRCESADPTVISSRIELCEADYGGGVACYNSEPSLAYTSIVENDAHTAGGGIAGIGISNLVITGCAVDSNGAGDYGGGLYIENADSLIIQHGTVFGNYTYEEEFGLGGGVYESSARSEYTLTVIGANYAKDGAAIYTNSPTVSIDRCTISENVIEGSGGAIYLSDITLATVNHSIISLTGGGSSVSNTTPVDVTLECSDVWGNIGGDYVHCLAGAGSSDGNISLDPQFCDGEDPRIYSYSPCDPEAPENQCHQLIGALLLGDANRDGKVNILDIIKLINYKYKGGYLYPPEYNCEVNGISGVNILDVVFLINYKYKDGPRPECPAF